MKRIVLLGLLIGGLVFSLTGCSMFNQGPEIQNWQPSVSPSSDEIVFSSKEENGFELFLMDPDSGEKTRITNNDYDDWGPDWGPKGERLAFVSKRDDNTDIYLIDVDGGNETRLTTNESQDVNPRWAGESEIIFNSDRTGSWEIFTVDLSEAKPIQLTSSSSEEEG
ncbi:PD40 domain-containing protein [Candidatus Bipolaricaulota bacterium]|nr:PD40 domain-containing protein [Candidatus Bipolaricaulota bacterium]